MKENLLRHFVEAACLSSLADCKFVYGRRLHTLSGWKILLRTEWSPGGISVQTTRNIHMKATLKKGSAVYGMEGMLTAPQTRAEHELEYSKHSGIHTIVDWYGFERKVLTLNLVFDHEMEAGDPNPALQEHRIEVKIGGYTKDEFIHCLENTLIPDLKESGMECTAQDFETAIQFLRV